MAVRALIQTCRGSGQGETHPSEHCPVGTMLPGPAMVTAAPPCLLEFPVFKLWKNYTTSTFRGSLWLLCFWGFHPSRMDWKYTSQGKLSCSQKSLTLRAGPQQQQLPPGSWKPPRASGTGSLAEGWCLCWSITLCQEHPSASEGVLELSHAGGRCEMWEMLMWDVDV